MQVMENSKDWTSLRAWASAIGVIGIPGAIAIFLVYMGATEIPRLSLATQKAATEIQVNQKLILDQTQKIDRLIRIAQRICSNAARNEEQRDRCFDD